MTITTEARNASIESLVEILRDQHGRKVDVVAPASSIRAKDGALIIKGIEPEITEDGVNLVDGRYVPTDVCDEGIAAKLNIGRAYLRRMRAERPDLYDVNVNGWLRGKSRRTVAGDTEVVYPADDRTFLIRGLRGENGEGIARAFLSDRYGIIDNIDALTAALDGVRQAGVNVEIDRCDLTDRRMYVRVVCQEVSALAPTLLAGYRSPFTGQSGTDNPTVFAGFVISNSETGGGAFTLTPQLVVQICRNGMTITRDAIKAVHLGSRLDEGVIRWSQDTERKALSLLTSKTKDAVATFLDTDYVTRAIAGMETKAGTPVTGAADAVKVLGRKLSFSQDESDAVLDHFIRGGQLTRGGLVNAITAYTQEIANADRAYEIEGRALEALEVSLG